MAEPEKQHVIDKMDASLDHEVNLRTGLEILRLHEKLDLVIAGRSGQSIDVRP